MKKKLLSILLVTCLVFRLIPISAFATESTKSTNISYIDENGEKQVPVMVHRAVLGSYERFIMLLLEQFKGVLPIWLSPVQVNIVPVNIKYHDEYCKKIYDLLLNFQANYLNNFLSAFQAISVH